MLFTNRLEVWNPGSLPPTLTLEKLRVAHGSVPGNPLLAEPMYLTGYIERMGTGTGDMIRRCRDAGLPEPEFALTDGFQIIIRRRLAHGVPASAETPTGEVAGEVTREVARLLLVCDGELTRQALQDRLGLRSEENFRNLYLVPALDGGLIEMTRPDAPRSRLQKYRLTDKGRAALEALGRRDRIL